MTNISGKPEEKMEKKLPTTEGGRVSPQGFTSGFDAVLKNF